MSEPRLTEAQWETLTAALHQGTLGKLVAGWLAEARAEAWAEPTTPPTSKRCANPCNSRKGARV